MLKGPIWILTQDTAIQTLVGLNEAGDKYKVYPVICPQPEQDPYIVLRQTSKVRQGKGCGFLCAFDVYTYHVSYDECEAIDLAVVSALDGKQQGTYNDVELGYMQHTNTSDQNVTYLDKQLYVKVSSFEVNVNE